LLQAQACETSQYNQALNGLTILLKDMNRNMNSLIRQLDSEKIKKSLLITNAVNLVDGFLKERDAIGWSLNSA